MPETMHASSMPVNKTDTSYACGGYSLAGKMKFILFFNYFGSLLSRAKVSGKTYFKLIIEKQKHEC